MLHDTVREQQVDTLVAFDSFAVGEFQTQVGAGTLRYDGIAQRTLVLTAACSANTQQQQVLARLSGAVWQTLSPSSASLAATNDCSDSHTTSRVAATSKPTLELRAAHLGVRLPAAANVQRLLHASSAGIILAVGQQARVNAIASTLQSTAAAANLGPNLATASAVGAAEQPSIQSAPASAKGLKARLHLRTNAGSATLSAALQQVSGQQSALSAASNSALAQRSTKLSAAVRVRTSALTSAQMSATSASLSRATSFSKKKRK